jgi:glycosyltransferase involved in cell wall biosynthesis
LIDNKPKLLFFAWTFPPVRAIGAVRTWNIAKYLARLGWEITVVTPRSSVWRNSDAEEKIRDELGRAGIHRIETDHRWRCLDADSLKCWNNGIGWFVGGVCRRIARCLGFDGGIGWSRAAQRACLHNQPGAYDVVLVSGPPFSSFLPAFKVSKRLGIPYVLDYRDTWTVDPYSERPAPRSIKLLEAKLLANSSAVTVVCPSWGSILDQEYQLQRKLLVISNGFDHEELAAVKSRSFGHFAIVYAGAFYPPTRVISPVMAALARVKETSDVSNPEWYFHYFGQDGDHVRKEADRFSVLDRVVFHGCVPRVEVLAALRGAGLSVVITSIFPHSSREVDGMVTGKLFEIVGLGTPVMLVAPPTGDIHRVAETTDLIHSFTGTDIDGIADFFRGAIHGLVARGKSPEPYAWVNIAKTMDSVLREVIHRKNVPIDIKSQIRSYVTPSASVDPSQ